MFEFRQVQEIFRFPKCSDWLREETSLLLSGYRILFRR